MQHSLSRDKGGSRRAESSKVVAYERSAKEGGKKNIDKQRGI
jgi:hypothetical protein